MKTIVFKKEEQLAKAGASLFAAEIVRKENAVLGLNAGNSTIAIYSELASLYQAGALDFSNVKTFDIDELAGIGSDSMFSFAGFVGKYFFSKVNIRPENRFSFDSFAPDLDAECQRIENMIGQVGGIDVMLVGFGNNGHVAFCEPAESLPDGCYVSTMEGGRLEATKRDFEGQPKTPSQALSMGMGTIMRSKQLVIVAQGKGKAEGVKHLLDGEISTQWPVSLLKLHPNATLLMDEDAASLL